MNPSLTTVPFLPVHERESEFDKVFFSFVPLRLFLCFEGCVLERERIAQRDEQELDRAVDRGRKASHHLSARNQGEQRRKNKNGGRNWIDVQHRRIPLKKTAFQT